MANTTPYLQRLLKEQGLELRYAEGRGRFVVAARDFQAGELVLRCEPYAFVLHAHLRESHCHHCFKPCTELKRCSACKKAMYCSPECQRAAWDVKYHKIECKCWRSEESRLLKALPLAVRDDVDLALRILWRREAELKEVPPGQQPVQQDQTQSFAEIEQLVSHVEEIARSDPPRKAGNEQLAQLVAMRYLEASGPKYLMHASKAYELLCKMQCNDFAIWDSLIISRGAGVYPLGALVNHSCSPSCAVTYDTTGRAMAQEMRCLSALKPGDEITHCYLDLASTSRDRNRDLFRQYTFKCSCQRCVSPEWLALDQKLTEVLPAGEQAGAAKLLERAAKLYDEGCDLNLEVEKCRESLEQSYELRRRLLGDLNLELMSTAAHLMTTCLEMSDLARAEVAAEHVLRVYRAVYQQQHPMIGLHLYVVGDIKAQLGKPEEATKVRQEALGILLLTHGPQHEMVKGLVGLLKKQRSTSFLGS